MNTKIIIILFAIISVANSLEINLNGEWQFGINRNYEKRVMVPGPVTDPAKFSPDKVWYKRELILPEGDWKYATLILNGALFAPEVHVNGVLVSQKNGGMAPTYHLLNSSEVQPGKTIRVEVALESLKNLPETNASYVPIANHWRSNISSYIWDNVSIKFHNEIVISRIVPYYNIQNKTIKFKYELENIDNPKSKMSYSIGLEINGLDKDGIISEKFINQGLEGEIEIHYANTLRNWSPESPNLYNAEISVFDENRTIASKSIKIGLKQFQEKDKQFFLNGKQCKIRAGTVVWHRWSRDKESWDLLYNTKWFLENVIKPLKERGANTLRFHLGNPPKRFIDLCDEYGLLVQYEWSFFHGMPASYESLVEQWDSWLYQAMKHPSIALVHPYNETTGDELEIAWAALDKILPKYPELVLEDRDVLHVHKYWWGMFENVGLYYDSYDEFDKAIMVDEFGGNYLDGDLNLGGYSSLKEAFLRFLGRNHTAEQRVYHHTISNSRIAEYWRRIGAAGISPFCILGSWEDGNHWYLGDIHEGKLKPVWDGLTAAWSPVSVSIDIWDRNFEPGQLISFPLYIFNDSDQDQKFDVTFQIEDLNGGVLKSQNLTYSLASFSQKDYNCDLVMPETKGRYLIKAELTNPPTLVKRPVISSWKVNVFKPDINRLLRDLKIAIPHDEFELLDFARQKNLHSTQFNDPDADVLLTSSATWEKIANKDDSTRRIIENAIKSGRSVVMLDIGDVFLGQGYEDQSKKMTHMQGRYTLEENVVNNYSLVKGIELSFQKIAEPESHIHPDEKNDILWENIPLDYTWLWNGLRGGLIVPANEMTISGLSPKAFLSTWKTKGAEEDNIIKSNSYFAYDLQGFYSFSDKENDKKIINELRNRVRFLVEDAPALTNSINPEAPVSSLNLSHQYKTLKGLAKGLHPLVNCGRNLTRTPVVLVEFGENEGKLLLSQLLTKGRLSKSSVESNGLYDVRYDVVANQFVLNMLKAVLE